MGSAIGFDNRADAEETVRPRHVIEHNGVNARDPGGARRHAPGSPPHAASIVMMML
jgi:hypothetical protein